MRVPITVSANRRLWLTSVFACFLAGSAPTPAGAHQIVAQPEVVSTWSGFGSDFQPEWSGQTKRIDKPVGPGGSSGSAIYFGFTPIADPVPAPIGLVSASRSHQVKAYASVDNVYANSEGGYSATRTGSWNVKAARFAEVVNLQDVLLDQGAAVAEQVAQVTHTSITATGRASAAARVHQGVLANASASSDGSSTLSAEYRVTEPVWFELTGMLAGAGSVDLGFTLKDDWNRATLYATNPAADGMARRFSLAGVLSPGTYSLSIKAMTVAQVDRLQSNGGGMGEFALSFVASPRKLGDVDGNGQITVADLTEWRRGFGYLPGGDLNGDRATDGADFLAWQREFAGGEGSSRLTRNPSEALNAWQASFGQLEAGDADGDHDSDGADFLLWQRKFGAAGSSAASVPEPAAGSLAAVAGLALAAARRGRAARVAT